MLYAYIAFHLVALFVEYLLWKKHLKTMLSFGAAGWSLLFVTIVCAPLFVFQDLLDRLWDKQAKDER